MNSKLRCTHTHNNTQHPGTHDIKTTNQLQHCRCVPKVRTRYTSRSLPAVLALFSKYLCTNKRGMCDFLFYPATRSSLRVVLQPLNFSFELYFFYFLSFFQMKCLPGTGRFNDSTMVTVYHTQYSYYSIKVIKEEEIYVVCALTILLVTRVYTGCTHTHLRLRTSSLQNRLSPDEPPPSPFFVCHSCPTTHLKHHIWIQTNTHCQTLAFLNATR